MGYTIIAYNKPTDKQGFIVFDSRLDNKGLTAGTLHQKLTDIDDLDITVDETNLLFDKLHPFQTHAEVYEDDKLIFRGRALKPTREMETSGGFIREFVFESIEAYLLDSIQRFDNDGGTNAKAYMQKLLKVHNDQVDKYKQFTLRRCDFGPKEGIVRRQIDYPKTRNAIQDQLLKKTGGFIHVEFDSEKRINYIDYVKTLGEVHKNDTPIAISKNMLSAKQTIDVTGVITKLIPLGKTKPNPTVKLGDDTTIDGSGDIVGATHAIKGDWGPAIKNAARIMGVSVTASDIAGIKAMIQGESNGSETVVNNWDKNAKAGHPSAGLLQFVERTFQNYMVKPFTKWKRGFDQLCALFNITDWRAEVQRWQSQRAWNPSGPKRLTSVNVKKQAVTGLNKWAWPFPSVGEGHFSSAQLFGVHPGNGRKNSFHDGLDFGSVDHPGSAVHAIHGGTVTKIGHDGFIGWYVLTHSKDGYDIIYQEAFSSASKIAVKQGQTIKTGAVIGYRDTSHVHIGATKKSWYTGYSGHSFDPHWYWLDPYYLIRDGGMKGDKESNITTYKDNSPQARYDIKSVNNGKDYLISDALVKEFGIIEGIQEFDDVSDPKQIMQLGQNWLKNEEKKVSKNSYEVSAVELPEFERFKIGDSYIFINAKVDPQQTALQIIEKDIDFTKERNSSLKIADVTKSLTDYQVEDQRSINHKFEQIQVSLSAQQTAISSLSSGSLDLDGSITTKFDEKQGDQGVFNTRWLKEHYDKAIKDFKKFKEEWLPKNYVKRSEFEELRDRVAALEQAQQGSGKK